MKLSLPTVTLFCADCAFVDAAIASIERCKSVCDFGAVKFLTSRSTSYPHIEIAPLNDVVDYSIFMLKRSHEFIDTEHFLVCQHDGWIINPETWNPAWLGYDYIAPIFTQEPRVGSGGFSLRSKRLMMAASKSLPGWDPTESGTAALQAWVGCYEDGHISGTLRYSNPHFSYAPVEEANKFAQGGNPDPAHFVAKPFGFHREGRNNLEGPLAWPLTGPLARPV